MTIEKIDTDLLEKEEEPASGYRSLGDVPEPDETDDLAFDDDDDPARRRDPLRKH